jgi:hypothetical protein
VLRDVEGILRTIIREESVNCPRKVASNKAASETSVSAMSNLEMRGCFFDGSASSSLAFREHEVDLDEHGTSRIRSTNGNTVASQKKSRNINEMLHRQVGQHSDANINVSGDVAWSYPRLCIDSTKGNHQLVSVDCDSQANVEEDLSPVIRLSLRKPQHWTWKLTTSASSPAIIVPAIRLLDEHGDLLIDTGEKSESRRRRRMFSSMRVDSNGNEKEQLSGLTQGSGGNWDNKHLNSRSTEDRSAAGSKNRRNVSLDGEHELAIRKRDGPKESPSMTGPDECYGSARGSRPKGTPRNKAHRRVLDRRRHRGHSSTSSDSSPEVCSGTKRRIDAKGRAACCTGHSPLKFGGKFRQRVVF